MKISSTAFTEGERIPALYTCEGQNTNPALLCEDVPVSARSLVLIMDDPDATHGGTWDHWIVWNIAPDIGMIAENWRPPKDVGEGRTSFGDIKYGGPCPPVGAKPHRYFFKLYALDDRLGLPSGSPRVEVERAMAGHIVANASCMGFFAR